VVAPLPLSNARRSAELILMSFPVQKFFAIARAK